jgi:hypothetical protein
MKFAVAFGILAHQALPVTSDEKQLLVAMDRIIKNGNKMDLKASMLASDPKESHNGGGAKQQRGRRALAARDRRSMQELFEGGKRAGGGLLHNKKTLEHANKPCNPVSDDPDVGILSCGNGSHCKEDANTFLGGICATQVSSKSKTTFGGLGKGGLLKNTALRQARPTSKVECDPSSTSTVDVGILSCGAGKQCLPSSASSMGGFCGTPEASAASRKLQNDYLFLICDPTSYYYGYYDCDCSGVDTSTGTGDASCTVVEDYCLGLSYTGCADTCGTYTVQYSFENFTTTRYGWCFNFSTPYEQTVCWDQVYGSDTCDVVFNDEACQGCDVLYDTDNSTYVGFDCLNVEAGTEGTTQYGLPAFPIVEACYTPGNNSECALCPGEGTMYNFLSGDDEVTVDGFGNFTCGTLYSNSYYFNSIADDYCPAVSAATSDACCRYFGNNSACALCPVEGTLFDYFSADDEVAVDGLGNFTCGALYFDSYYFNTIADDQCPAVSAAASNACCSYYCDLCGPTSYIAYEDFGIDLDVPVPGYEGLTCGGLSYAAYFNATLDPDSCPSAKVIATPCCSEYIRFSCDLCEDLPGMELDPDATFEVYGEQSSCALFLFADETECQESKPLAPICCAMAPASSGPTQSPTTASPSPPDATGAPTGAPASGAADLLSPWNLASKVGLLATAAAVVFAIN